MKEPTLLKEIVSLGLLIQSNCINYVLLDILFVFKLVCVLMSLAVLINMELTINSPIFYMSAGNLILIRQDAIAVNRVKKFVTRKALAVRIFPHFQVAV